MDHSVSIRTRFAPSPTGPLHLGGARTAIFNWLFARNTGGVFVLRIEDTDLERSETRYERDILEQLQWLGIDWDEGINVGGVFGPYRQTERAEQYARYIEALLDSGSAYRCFCSKEELEAERAAAFQKGEAPRYSGKCRSIPFDEAEARMKRGEQYIIRFKVPHKQVAFQDIIRGMISFDAGLMGDIAIAKNETTPLYNFAVAVDDFDMKISHVIRGEDHISNTPKQIVIQEAIGAPMPTYAHVPLILSPDKSKMSKRKGFFAVSDYREQGYFPEALFNFLALLGWHPEDDRELLTRESFIKEFSLERVQKGGAVFNKEKLDWINAEYLRALDVESLYGHLRNGLEQRGWNDDEQFVKKILYIERERMKTCNDFFELADFFFVLPEYPAEMLNWKENSNNQTARNLELAIEVLNDIDASEFIAAHMEKALIPLAEKTGRGDVLWPLRVALSGKKASPGPYEIMEILGKEESLRRIEAGLKKL